jgi:ribose transport system substrate-binding protein
MPKLEITLWIITGILATPAILQIIYFSIIERKGNILKAKSSGIGSEAKVAYITILLLIVAGAILWTIFRPAPVPPVPTPTVAAAEKTNLELQNGKPFRHIGPNRQHPVVRTILLGFEDACKDFKVECVNNAFEGVDFSLMVPQVDIALSQGSSGVIAFVDKAVYESDKRLIAGGFPVLNIHGVVKKEDLPGLTAWISPDIEQYSKDVALAMGEKLAGKGTVLISQGNLNDLENEVSKIFTATLAEKYPNIKVLPVVLEGFDVPAGIAIAEASLQANPAITGIFGTTGNSAVVWAKALEANGKKPGEVTVIGMDTVAQNLDLVEAGWVYGVVAQPLYDEEYMAVKLMVDKLHGKEVKYDNLLASPLVKKGETQKYYDIVKRVAEQEKK